MTKKKRKKREKFISIDELVSERQAKDVNDVIDSTLTFGEKLSDTLASFAGSWGFIIFFGFIIISWVVINMLQLNSKAFDPYPFILLNLLLSMTAALQAPIIMMSQNRQEDKDRIRSEHDYNVNLKAEILVEEILLRLDTLEEQNDRLIAHIKKEEEHFKQNKETNTEMSK